MEQLVCNEGDQDFNKVKVHATKQQSHFSMTGRNSSKLVKGCNNYNENITIASNYKKWNQALKKQKYKTLGYFLKCTSEIIKNADKFNERFSN